jgi:hypothetical protein
MEMAIGNYLTTEEVAEKLGVTPGRVRQFVYDDRLKPKEKIGQVLFFDKDEVQKFAKLPRKTGRPKSDD